MGSWGVKWVLGVGMGLWVKMGLFSEMGPWDDMGIGARRVLGGKYGPWD